MRKDTNMLERVRFYSLILSVLIGFIVCQCGNYAYANEAIEVGGGTSVPTEKGNIRFLEYDGVATTDTFNLLSGMGYWWDTSEGAKDSLYLRSGLGIVVNNCPGFYPSIYIGPAYVVHTDEVLRTNFQWALEGNLMFVDNRYLGIGACVKHFSNAGITSNEGRNFIGLRIQWR